MDKLPIPQQVLSPGAEQDFIPVANHSPTNTASLGYSIIRALGVHKDMPQNHLDFIQNWSDEFSRVNGGVTPQAGRLVNETFKTRLGGKYCSEEADANAACYPGVKGSRRPPYREIFESVWIAQKWPELCRVIAEFWRQDC